MGDAPPVILLAPGVLAAYTKLKDLLGENYHAPGSGNFEVWDAKQQEAAKHSARVTPTSSQDVVDILRILLDNWCPFAVKCGGHARNANDSVSVGGVTIDLSNLRSVEVASDRKSAKVGGGHVLLSLYQGLEKYGLCTIGGRVADVGLGGYALGGGLSNLSPAYGLAVDNILEYEVVLPDASLAIVNEKTNPDIYWALRGGTNNFGIVTQFTMNTFEQGKMYSGSSLFSADKRDALVDEAYKLTTDFKHDTKMTHFYGYSYNQQEDRFRISFGLSYTDPVGDAAPFAGLRAIEAEKNGWRVDWMSNFSIDASKARPNGARNLYATISYYPSAELDRKIQDIMAEELQPIKKVEGFSPNVISQPMYENAIRNGQARGGNALGIEADGPLTLILLTVGWSSAQDDEALYAFANRFIAKAKAASVEAGKDHRWMYINYAFQDQDPYGGYGEENRARLKKIQKEIDPKGVFTSKGLCRGYWKLH